MWKPRVARATRHPTTSMRWPVVKLCSSM
jgi:hypothetical protein